MRFFRLSQKPPYICSKRWWLKKFLGVNLFRRIGVSARGSARFSYSTLLGSSFLNKTIELKRFPNNVVRNWKWHHFFDLYVYDFLCGNSRTNESRVPILVYMMILRHPVLRLILGPKGQKSDGPISYRYRDKRWLGQRAQIFPPLRSFHGPAKGVSFWNFVTAVGLKKIEWDAPPRTSTCVATSIRLDTIGYRHSTDKGRRLRHW